MPDPSIFTKVIDAYLPEPHASLLNGILFGVKLTVSGSFYTEVKKAGLLHIVVLSGINITMLASIIGIITKRLGKHISTLITMSVIVLFIVFVGPQAPIVRAGIMGVLTLVSIVYGRKTIALYSLFISILIIVIFWPEWITTVSLHLSFGATLGIILFGSGGKKSKKSLPLVNIITHELRPSLAAQLFTAPIIFWYFREVSLIAPISNILVGWVIPPLMIVGFTTAFLGSIAYPLGVVPGALSWGMLEYMITVINFSNEIPYAFVTF